MSPLSSGVLPSSHMSLGKTVWNSTYPPGLVCLE
jgi:hypothetical protein